MNEVLLRNTRSGNTRYCHAFPIIWLIFYREQYNFKHDKIREIVSKEIASTCSVPKAVTEVPEISHHI